MPNYNLSVWITEYLLVPGTGYLELIAKHRDISELKGCLRSNDVVKLNDILYSMNVAIVEPQDRIPVNHEHPYLSILNDKNSIARYLAYYQAFTHLDSKVKLEVFIDNNFPLLLMLELVGLYQSNLRIWLWEILNDIDISEYPGYYQAIKDNYLWVLSHIMWIPDYNLRLKSLQKFTQASIIDSKRLADNLILSKQCKELVRRLRSEDILELDTSLSKFPAAEFKSIVEVQSIDELRNYLGYASAMRYANTVPKVALLIKHFFQKGIPFNVLQELLNRYPDTGGRVLLSVLCTEKELRGFKTKEYLSQLNNKYYNLRYQVSAFLLLISSTIFQEQDQECSLSSKLLLLSTLCLMFSEVCREVSKHKPVANQDAGIGEFYDLDEVRANLLYSLLSGPKPCLPRNSTVLFRDWQQAHINNSELNNLLPDIDSNLSPTHDLTSSQLAHNRI